MNRRNFCKLMAGAAALAATRPSSLLASAAPVSTCRRGRLTVVRRTVEPELQGRYLDDPETGPCPRMTVGQTWSVDIGSADPSLPPRGMCPTAWTVICGRLASAESCAPSAAEATTLLSCGDPTRAVIFRLDYDPLS